MAPAAPAAPAAALPLIVRPGVHLQTRTGHCCATWNPVPATTGYQCRHGHVLWRPDIQPALLRAGERR